MKRKYLSILLAASLALSFVSPAVISAADGEESSDEKEDSSDDREDEKEEKEEKDEDSDRDESDTSDSGEAGSSDGGEGSESAQEPSGDPDAGLGTGDVISDSSDIPGAGDGYESQGGDAFSEGWGDSSEDDVASDDGDDVGAADDMIYDIVPTTLMDEDEINGLFPTSPPDESARTVDRESEEEASGVSSVPDPDELNMRPDDVVAMVMPVMTNDMYNFTIDPYNLLGRYASGEGSYDNSGFYFKNAGEELVYSDTSDAAMAKNKSSVPVFMYVTIDMENKDEWPVDFRDMDAVGEGEDTSMSLAIVPVGEEDGEKVYYTDRQIDIDRDGHAEAVFYLDGTPDNFQVWEGGVVAREDAEWSSLGFAVTGKCNSQGDWSEIFSRADQGEKMVLRVSCRMKPLSPEEREAVENGDCIYDEKTGLIDF